MIMELDAKDRRILYELDKNARQPLSRIAKKVLLNRESVLYRIKKLFDKGIVRNYLTVINTSMLGFTHYKIYIKFQNINENQEKRFISDLTNNPHITWVASCDGSYSLIFAIKARTITELNDLLKVINNSYWKFIKEQHITTIINANHYYRDYLLNKSGTTERKINWGGNPKNIELDKINIEVLDQLSKNSRVTSVEIASKLGISADAVVNRIKKLQNEGIIQNYMLWPNVSLLEGFYYKVLVKTHSVNTDDEKRLKDYCRNNPNIVYALSCLGDWQFEMDLEVKNISEFREIIRDFSNKFNYILSDCTILSIYMEYKFRFFEKNILKT
ncbi:Lrp/AsnC family transcriptional regulator [Candidatus Pacearchaeota archaeon]|nr:Lrp/AsnC family transcriptional regulator [Candidatus Pacearchaeota archaeon]